MVRLKNISYSIALIALFIFLVSSCATIPERRAPAFEDEDARARIVDYAQSLLGREQLEGIGPGFRSDCSGYIIGVYKRMGYRFVVEPKPGDSSMAQSLFWTLFKRNLVYRNRSPKEADLVFFKGTTDRRKDRISHVGIVAFVEEDGTILVLHYGSRGVAELRMNLRRPDTYKGKGGRVLNDFLKKGSGKRLSGQLFYSYGDLLKYIKSTL
jgi:hypothetical protein